MVIERSWRQIPMTDAQPPVLVCLLGNFRLLADGHTLAVHRGGKTEALLRSLALDRTGSLPREVILDRLWPGSDPILAGQSLNSLVYGLHRLIGPAVQGAPPILHDGGRYRLNDDAGIGVDVARFDSLADVGDSAHRTGDHAGASSAYALAVDIYRGDLSAGSDLAALVESERLRARYLTVLGRLANDAFERGDIATALDTASRLLAHDPCREDAHRLVMRCYVRVGQRAQALRQFRLCAKIMRAEFGTVPEAATSTLYEQIRLTPERV